MLQGLVEKLDGLRVAQHRSVRLHPGGLRQAGGADHSPGVSPLIVEVVHVIRPFDGGRPRPSDTGFGYPFRNTGA